MAVEQYRQYIQQLLSERAERASRQRSSEPEYKVQTVFDREQDHYQCLDAVAHGGNPQDRAAPLMYVGWRGYKRDFGCILHVDIQDGKIWIQHDGTEVGLANQ